jgi:hypothetical protein
MTDVDVIVTGPEEAQDTPRAARSLAEAEERLAAF